MPPREVAEPKKPASANKSSDSTIEGCAAVIALVAIVVVGVICSVKSYVAGRASMWVEAEKHEFAERVYQTSEGEVYRWKSPTELQHIRLFWEEAVRRGFAERSEWPEGLGEFRWKESNDGIQ